MILTELNRLSIEELNLLFMQCCSSTTWVNNMVNARPFIDQQILIEAANLAWQGLMELDYLEAFEGHPKIGDINSLRTKYANTKTLASGEQCSVSQASEQVLADLSAGNDDYFAKFGFIFIVCATGKSAEEMLALLHSRLLNDRATELKNAVEEQRKIFQIRLKKCLEKK